MNVILDDDRKFKSIAVRMGEGGTHVHETSWLLYLSTFFLANSFSCSTDPPRDGFLLRGCCCCCCCFPFIPLFWIKGGGGVSGDFLNRYEDCFGNAGMVAGRMLEKIISTMWEEL